MNKFFKKFLLFFSSILIGISIIVLPFIFFIKSKTNLVFGNFQSYISPEVQNELSNEYGISFQYYASNAEIPTYIKNKTLDIAIASNNMISQLIIEDEIQKIPWDKFDLEYYDSQTNTVKAINNYLDVKNIVTDFTWNLCELMGQSLGINNLLEYCVPYFMQKFLFAYRGPYINELSRNASYSEIFNYISKNEYFTSSNSSIMMIQDARSVYNVSSIIANSPINDGINPKNSIMTPGNIVSNKNSPSIKQLENVYQSILNYYQNQKKNIITFNSDSSILLNKLALHQINGAFLYTGDVIYSALNGDNSINSSDKLPNFDENRDFHAISPNNNFYAMDGIVFNKSLIGERQNEAIKIVKSLCLSGLNVNENIKEMENDSFVYTSMENFSSILYTPCYSKIYDYALDDYFNNETDNIELINFLKEVITIDADLINENNIEKPLNNLVESNLNVAFESFMNKI